MMSVSRSISVLALTLVFTATMLSKKGVASPNSSGAAASTGGTSAGSSSGAAATSPSSSSGGGASPTNSGDTLLSMGKKTLFVLSFANDPLTSSYVSYEMSSYLQPLMKRGWWVMPVPAWSLSDLQTQCDRDKGHVLGALILYDIENDTGNFNFIIEQNVYTHLYARAMLVRCQIFEDDAPKATPNATPMPTTVEITQSVTEVVKLPKTAGVKSIVGVRDRVSATVTYTRPSPSPTEAPARMEVVWENIESLDADGHEGSVPFIGLAGLGSYLASRIMSTTTMSATTTPTHANGIMYGSTTDTVSHMGNNSTLPFGIAIAGTSFGQLGGINFGGTNANRVLKSAAARLASLIGRQWYDSCDPMTTNGSRVTPATATLSRDPEQCHFLLNFLNIEKAPNDPVSGYRPPAPIALP